MVRGSGRPLWRAPSTAPRLRPICHTADAAHLRDFGWHELVVSLPYAASERTVIDSSGLEISLTVPEDSDVPPEPTPVLDLYVDDIWLE